jgi:RecB family exonuclease
LRRQAGRVAELFGEKPDLETLKKEGTAERFIPPDPEKPGLFVTEPNQMTKRRFARVLFIGGDLSAFPPKSGGDIFRSARQKEALLGHNNSYRLSAHYFSCMRKNAGALHVAWPRNEGRRPLHLSPVLSGIEAPPLEVSNYRIERDALLGGERAKLPEEAESYIAAMKSPEATPYDGAMRSHTFCRQALSATALETYAKCPLRYLFARRYELEAPAVEKDEERFEASDIGTIFHEVAQRFAEEVKKGALTLDREPDDASRRRIEAIADEVFEAYMQKEVDAKDRRRTLFHELVLTDLKKGLYDAHHAPGLLIRLLRYFHAEGRPDHLAATERYFRLDDDFAPARDNEALVQGFIDRIDTEGGTVRVVDYKTGGYKKEKEDRLYEEMAALRAFQLPLYLLYAKAAYDAKTLEAHLVSFRHNDGYKIYGYIGTDEEARQRFDAEYEARLKERIRTIDAAMRSGEYGMTPSERNCEYCDYTRICHASVLPHKEAQA